MGNPVDILTDVALNFATGGLYGIGKAIAKTVEEGSPMPLLTQGLDLGGAAIGVDIATELGGPQAGIAFNLAGLTAGTIGAAGGFSSLPGFAPGGGVAPLAAAPAGAAPLAPGVEMGAAGSANYVAPGMSAVGAPAAAETAATASAPGGLANLAGLPGGVVAGEGSIAAPVAAAAAPGTVTSVAPSLASTAAPETAGYLGELKNAAPALESAPSTQSWFASLSPGAQTALVTGGFAGAQMLTGGMQGLFQGVSAQKRLELEQLINAQNQQQVQYRNKNNAYAPLLTFKQPGLAQTVV